MQFRPEIYRPDELPTKADLLENPLVEYKGLICDAIRDSNGQWKTVLPCDPDYPQNRKLIWNQEQGRWVRENPEEPALVPLFFSFIDERYVIHPFLDEESTDLKTFSLPVMEFAWNPYDQLWDFITDDSPDYKADFRVIMFWSKDNRYTPYYGHSILTPPGEFFEFKGCLVIGFQQGWQER